MADLNMNTLTQANSSNTTIHLMDFCDLFALSHLVNVTRRICGTSLDIMLTNKPRSFYNTSAVTTDLSDCQV